MRVGAIDVGTNSVHLLVAEIRPDGAIQVIETQREQVELGSGGLDQRQIAPDAMDRGIAAIERFRHACDSLDVEDIYATATSAVREASNGADFCRRVKERTGVHVRIIPGTEEARLIYLGARSELNFSAGRVLLFDLGGGSTEFILCDAESALVTCSLPIGHIRLSERWHRTDPLGEEGYRALKKAVREQLAALGSRIGPNDFATLVGTSGAARTLARMATLRRGEIPPDHDHGLVLHRADLDALVKAFRELPAEQYAQLPGMDPKRRRTLPAGAVVIREVMKAFRKTSLVTSERGLRDGLVVDWVGKHRPEVTLSAHVPDPRRRAVLAMLDRYRGDTLHAHFVASTARRLFDLTAPLHRLRIDDRRLLVFAALLHDIGHHIDGKDHHKHGQYLIRHTRMPGFTAPELTLLGLLVRYHRGGRPKPRHPEFQALKPADRRRVRILAGLLRVADALDRGHQQNVEELDLDLQDRRVVVRAGTREAPDLERWDVLRRSDLLCEALSCTLDVEFEAPAPVAPPSPGEAEVR